MNRQTSPARLSVFNDVEQEGPIWQFTGIAVVATIVNLDFNAFLAQRTAVVVGEQNFQFLSICMPCDKIWTCGGHNQITQGRLRVHDVPVHADLSADITHDGRNGVGDHSWTSVGEFKSIVKRGPGTHLTSFIDGAGTQIVLACRHFHGWRDNVFAPFSRGVSEEDVFAAGNDASVPQVLASR